MAHYTWSKNELYNKDGVQIFIIRAKEDSKKVVYELIQNGVSRNVKREEVDPYLDPNRAERKAKTIKGRQTNRARRGNRANFSTWAEDLDFTWA